MEEIEYILKNTTNRSVASYLQKFADKDMCQYLAKYGKTKEIALMYAKLGKKFADKDMCQYLAKYL